MLNFDLGTVMRVRESRIILRTEPVFNIPRKKREHENLKEDRAKAYSGYLSKSACCVIEKRMQCWLNAIFINNKDIKSLGIVRPYLPVMITVTLASKQVHNDKFIKRHLLQEFLKALSRKKNIRYTFWKAEAQLNGNIHFHIIIDQYIDMKFVQGLWNYYQLKHGYLNERISQGLDKNPPSTKITGMQGNKSPIAYILKYVQKSKYLKINCKHNLESCQLKCAQLKAIRRPIDGAVFRFSSALVGLCPASIFTSMDLHSHLQERVQEGKLRYVRCDYCEILYCIKCKAYDQLTEWYRNELDLFYRSIFKFLYIDNGVRIKVLPSLIKTKSIDKTKQLRLDWLSAN